jgi:hypothetical protein|tara:strand:- start:336 stop:581 length:246 start_codon:yes stop_codon:yes gene_type:complete
MAIDQLQDMTNADFGTLDSTKNKHMIVYDAASDTFVIRDMDTVLSSDQVLDGDLPDDFIDQIEEEIDVNAMTLDKIDGGSF